MRISKEISSNSKVAFEYLFEGISPALSRFDFIIRDCDGFKNTNQSESKNLARKKQGHTSVR
ncbi:hypothetical protein [Ochrobactrum teleogrylli]|uniref:Uncharacterized protein n=1 Tax=Ochrobactrum teleogrylli TaxID=2479765 RepID=A0ABY2YA30_9HYPH|nr:hypothetical protein [[Ochrobactrum] teleogrylli]TNV18772.1 hypothetical protein FIC94_03965 [[Ochrobactrum] teleogrylli]